MSREEELVAKELRRELVWDNCEVVYENFKKLWKQDKDVINVCGKFFKNCMEVFTKYFIEVDVGGIADKSLMPSTLLHILIPFSGYVCTSILHGMIPAAYFSLRQIIEALIIAVYMDVSKEYKDKSYKEKFSEASKLRVGRIIDSFKNLDEKLRSRLRDLYNLLSSYMHPFAKKGLGGLIGLANHMITNLGGPPTFLVVPMPSEYIELELDQEELNRVKTVISDVEEIILKLMDIWEQHYIAKI